MKARRIVISTVLLVGGLLSIVQIMPKNPLLIGERLFPYGGWIQVILAMLYSGWLCHKMQDRQERPKWRKRAWLLFSIVFFRATRLRDFCRSHFPYDRKTAFADPCGNLGRTALSLRGTIHAHTIYQHLITIRSRLV